MCFFFVLFLLVCELFFYDLCLVFYLSISRFLLIFTSVTVQRRLRHHCSRYAISSLYSTLHGKLLLSSTTNEWVVVCQLWRLAWDLESLNFFYLNLLFVVCVFFCVPNWFRSSCYNNYSLHSSYSLSFQFKIFQLLRLLIHM